MQRFNTILPLRRWQRQQSRAGFTLLEVSMSMGILSVISLLSFVALRASVESSALARAKEDTQSALRDTMGELVFEVREAFTERTVDHLLAPDDTEAIDVSSTRDMIVFQAPELTTGEDMVVASAPITIFFENEDGGESESDRNSKLDPGEDENEDGALTRRLVLVQGDEERIRGATNNISHVEFELLPNLSNSKKEMTRLRIKLESSKRYGLKDQLIRAELETTIDLKN